MTTIIVTLEPGADRLAIRNTLQARGTITDLSAIPDVLFFDGPADALAWIEAVPGVKSALLDGPTAPMADIRPTPGWPDMQGVWNLVLAGQKPGHRLFNNARALIQRGLRPRFTYNPVNAGAGVNFYLPDSGVRSDHVEFVGRVTRIFNGLSPGDVGFGEHGAYCAAAGAGANLGVAPAATILDAKCFPSDGGIGNTSVIVNAMNACITHYQGQSNPGVMSCSFGATGFSDPYAAAVNASVAAGLILVAAAGNSGLDIGGSANSWPGESANAIGVGGLDPRNRIAPESNFGTPVDFWSPFSQWTTVDAFEGTSGYNVHNVRGTSLSCPMVAGMIARALTGTTRMTTQAQVDAFRAQFIADYGVEDVRNQNGTPATGLRRLWIPDVEFAGWEPYTEPEYRLPDLPISVDHARAFAVLGTPAGHLKVDHARTYVIVDTIA